MNTFPSAIRILCYGDSNTWGQTPEQKGRFSISQRWTGILQNRLGNGYEVIEEGLSGRTTDLDHLQPEKVGRNGRAYLSPCLVSHNPLGFVVLMLGTNDFKKDYGRTAEDVAAALSLLVADISDHARNTDGNVPHIVVVSPAHIDTQAPQFAARYTEKYDESGARESRRLFETLHDLKLPVRIIDAASVAKVGEDGIHLDAESHVALAELLAKVVFDS